MTDRMMALGRTAATLVCLAAASAAQARDRTIEDVPSVVALDLDRLKPSAIVFNDQSLVPDNDSGPAPGLISFDEWARTRPDEKQLLGLYPGYTEPEVKRAGNKRGSTTSSVTMYVAKARFILDRAVTKENLARYISLSFIEKVDPAIKHKLITPAEIMPLTNPKASRNRNPLRPWCVGTSVVCFRSHYRLEGKLPLGIQLANKVRDANKKISEYLEFESELAIRAPDEIDQPLMKRLTALDTPVAAALAQSTFHVNQVLQFAKSTIIFQQHPASTDKTVVTAFMAIAVESRLLYNKKEYAKVPVLRNLVPVQVLMGKSSFNSGDSVSAGLPNYARSRIRAIARILDAG